MPRMEDKEKILSFRARPKLSLAFGTLFGKKTGSEKGRNWPFPRR